MDYQREVRLGLVLYGGVSLAVYENGIAQEFYRAIRSDGVYELLKYLIDSEIIVDVISGTSAGGVNGVMLGYALATGRDFAPSSDLWRDEADIDRLLRKENDSNPHSILSSDYYQKRLEECFRNKLRPSDAAPHVEELDVFITGTDANGEIYTVYDDDGHAIDVKNHRALFKLSVRGERKNDFKDATPEELAKLSRLTSCFPVAFEPVRIEKTEKNFRRWGKLRGAAVYLDGGILNNKPFTSTIDDIFRRTANRDVERFLIYVEPDPENFKKSTGCPHSPSVVDAGASALVSIPGYQSIAADLEAVEQHNQRAQRIEEIWKSLPEAAGGNTSDMDEAGVVAPNDHNEAYYRARFIQLRDTAVECILNDARGRAYLSSRENRRAGRLLVTSFDAWTGDPDKTLEEYDVFYRMRRASYLSHVLMRQVKKHERVPSNTWDVVNHYFKLYEIVEWAMVTWLNQWDYKWRDLSERYSDLDTQPKDIRDIALAGISAQVWGAAGTRLNELLYLDIPVPAEVRAESRQSFRELIGKALDGRADKPQASNINLLQALDDALKSALRSLGNYRFAVLLRKEFCRFLEVDRQLFLVQIGSGFESTDTVRVVRFSPQDAQRGLSAGEVSEKVCGKALSAFGGFFKMGWRANDVFIGRLDAACLLIECLLTKERLAELGAGRSVTRQQVRRAFPTLEAEKVASLRESLNSYLANPQGATTETWGALIEKLVIAAHHEIEKVEWPNVVRCSIEQEYSWARYRRGARTPPYPYDPSTLAWDREKASPDKVLVEVAANAIASKKLPPFKPGSVAGQAFLDEIPAPVLEELGSLAAIRMGKSLLDSIPNADTRQRVEQSAFYKWSFRRVATLFYKWAHMRRTSPESVVIFNTVVPTICLTAFLIDAIILWNLGVNTLTVHPLLWLAVLGGPLMLLIVWCIWFRR